MNGNQVNPANPVSSIKIRMYNTGSVGDCILLLFQKGDEVSFSMLIDCGGIKTTTALVTPCVQDIKMSCNGKLDLLIVTHQHEDHISGFNLARSVFDQIEVQETWMSWVENPNDPVAAVLKKKYGKKLKELKAATLNAISELDKLAPVPSDVKGLKKRIDQHKQNIQQTLSLLEFEESSSHGAHLAAGSRTNEDAMDYAKKKGKKMNYRLPGEVIKMKGAEGVKFYILGPPRDNGFEFLKIEMNEEEMYHLAATAPSKDDTADTGHLQETGITLEPKVSPFSEDHQLSGKEKSDFFKQYNSSDMKWRQIETDWLGIAHRYGSCAYQTGQQYQPRHGAGVRGLRAGDPPTR